MLKSINWKAIFKTFAWLVCLAGLVVLMSFIERKKQEVKCTKIEIIIPGANNFIEREEIDEILSSSYGSLVGKNLSQINIHQVENAIKANPYIAFVKVYADMDGVINIEIKQRQPVLRIINAGGQDFYVDEVGLKIPVSSNYTANVLVATGNILEGFSGKTDTLFTVVAKNLYKAALYAKKDSLWDAQFEQFYVNEKSDIEIVPRVGIQRIILGNADSLAVKMKNLLAFYQQAMPKVGWDAYKTINLKYINQIVCEKYDSLAVNSTIQSLPLDSNLIVKKAVDSAVKKTVAQEIKKIASKSVENPAVSKPTDQKDKTKTLEIKPKQTTPKKQETPKVKETKAATTSTKKVAVVKEKVSTKKIN